MGTLAIALAVFMLLGEGGASIQDHCTDVSYWDEIRYETTTKQCCDTKLHQVCTAKSDQICQDVLELQCEVAAWGECKSTPTSAESTKCGVRYNDFAHQNCQEVTTSVKHTKKVPECKEITKNNCVTDWEVDDDGNKVWAGTESCTPVTWEECDIVEKMVEFPTVKTECYVDSHIKWVEFVDSTANIVGLESKCEVKKAVNCKHVVANKCAAVEWQECKMEPREECLSKVIHTPNQEKIHQKKCLTGDKSETESTASSSERSFHGFTTSSSDGDEEGDDDANHQVDHEHQQGEAVPTQPTPTPTLEDSPPEDEQTPQTTRLVTFPGSEQSSEKASRFGVRSRRSGIYEGKPWCRGRNFPGGRECCEADDQGPKCTEGQGDCDSDAGCAGDLVCGKNNCRQYHYDASPNDDCCTESEGKPWCRGRNFPGGRECCEADDQEPKCTEGQGDCDSDAGCAGELVCGKNNCRQYHSDASPNDDCCTKRYGEGKPWCRGRNFPGGRECCEADDQEPKCTEGQGDCDSHAGCAGNFVCGKNNCRQYHYDAHPNDDCCTKDL